MVLLFRERARGSATEKQGFTRIVRRKNLTLDRDSIARVTYDPAHIPDSRHVRKALFVSPIPYAKNGQGYLRVTKSSLSWQQSEVPGVRTSEGLTTCVEKEYKWSVNSTTWNHIRAMWLPIANVACPQGAQSNHRCQGGDRRICSPCSTFL